MRSVSPRDVCADVSRFLDRAAKPYARTGKDLVITTHQWSAESARGKPTSYFGEWPSECTTADFDAAVGLAHERFGKPTHRTNARNLELSGAEYECFWRVSIDRVDEVLEFLESVPTCTAGEFAPVSANYSCLFLLRDLETGAVMPKQGTRYYPLPLGTLSVNLQRQCWGNLRLLLPFPEPDQAVADYVVALQEHAPLWIDPRYFDHVVPGPDNSRFHATRLPPSWIGVTPAGELRLDVARTGIVPLEIDLPTDAEMAEEDIARDDAPYSTNYLAVAMALRDLSTATLVIRGAEDADYMVEQAAAWLDMPVHAVRTLRQPKSPSIEEELRTIISGLDGRRAVLFLEIVPWGTDKVSAALPSQMHGRVLMGVELPPEVRLVVSVEHPLRAPPDAQSRYDMALTEGFLTKQQRDFMWRQARRATWREVVVEVLR